MVSSELTTTLLVAFLAGVFATAVLDIFGIILNKLFGLPTTEWRFVGRWFGHMKSGVIRHALIMHSPPVKNELAIGWTMHYVIGVVFSLAYFIAVIGVAETEPTLTSATIFGIITVGAPWFLMQPSLGYGYIASKHPKVNTLRVLNIMGHVTFGQSLFLFHSVAAKLV